MAALAGVKVTDIPEKVKEKSAVQLVVWAEDFKVRAVTANNNSVNNFFINMVLISNVVFR